MVTLLSGLTTKGHPYSADLYKHNEIHFYANCYKQCMSITSFSTTGLISQCTLEAVKSIKQITCRYYNHNCSLNKIIEKIIRVCNQHSATD
ncbi:hypothetical protein V1477_013035 [Vespula maculifrons]|uniref:Uncharacterized protein n=1 Tax=Vespula maculifrons TaxID=7453 RepID=A0ABD2BUR9_VESMC